MKRCAATVNNQRVEPCTNLALTFHDVDTTRHDTEEAHHVKDPLLGN